MSGIENQRPPRPINTGTGMHKMLALSSSQRDFSKHPEQPLGYIMPPHTIAAATIQDNHRHPFSGSHPLFQHGMKAGFSNCGFITCILMTAILSWRGQHRQQQQQNADFGQLCNKFSIAWRILIIYRPPRLNAATCIFNSTEYHQYTKPDIQRAALLWHPTTRLSLLAPQYRKTIINTFTSREVSLRQFYNITRQLWFWIAPLTDPSLTLNRAAIRLVNIPETHIPIKSLRFSFPSLKPCNMLTDISNRWGATTSSTSDTPDAWTMQH